MVGQVLSSRWEKMYGGKIRVYYLRPRQVSAVNKDYEEELPCELYIEAKFQGRKSNENQSTLPVNLNAVLWADALLGEPTVAELLR